MSLGESSVLSQTRRQRRRQTKSDAILAAAQHLLLAQGYGNTNMDAVAKEANVSKATLYAIFSSKAELFAAVITQTGATQQGLMLPSQATRAELATILSNFGASLLALLLSPGTTSAYRSIAAEANRAPELGRMFYDNGPNVMLGRLEAFFATCMKQKLLRTASPRTAAVHFVGLIRGDLHTKALLGMGGEITSEDHKIANSQGVEAFLHAYVIDR